MAFKDWFTRKPKVSAPAEPEVVPLRLVEKLCRPDREPEVELLLDDTIKKLNVIKAILSPLEDREEELQKQFAPIRYDLRAVCKEITKIKKETDFYTLNNLVMKLQ
jgi:hypothetical protein